MYGGFFIPPSEQLSASFRRSTADNISPNTNMNPTTFHRLPNKSRPHSCTGEQAGKPSSYPNSRVIILSATTGHDRSGAQVHRGIRLCTRPARRPLPDTTRQSGTSFFPGTPYTFRIMRRPALHQTVPKPAAPSSTTAAHDRRPGRQKNGAPDSTPEPRIRYPLRDENSTGVSASGTDVPPVLRSASYCRCRDYLWPPSWSPNRRESSTNPTPR